MIEDIKKNINSEIDILREIFGYNKKIYSAGPSERNLMIATVSSLRASLKILNDSIPVILSEISLDNKLPQTNSTKSNTFEQISLPRGASEIKATVPTRNKKELLEELSIGEGYIKKLKKRQKEPKEEHFEFRAARGFLKLSNKLFFNSATNFIEKGYFKKLSKEIRKANIDILFHSYVAVILMSTFLSVIVSLIILVLLMFFNFSMVWPIMTIYNGEYINRFMQIFWIPLVLPISTFISLYFYPSTEKQALAKGVNQELPFAIIHMSAISGSGIQPAEIFRIIGLSKEYPYLRKEIRKVLNQINIYGYDLITALNNAASSTSSVKLAELFSGLATTINSGGGFQDFFDKRAGTLLMDYRLEREKHTKTAETFMDIYISIVIAAPMILMLFLIILTVGSFDVGLSTGQLTFLIIGVTVAINVAFLIFLHLNQPSY